MLGWVGFRGNLLVGKGFKLRTSTTIWNHHDTRLSKGWRGWFGSRAITSSSPLYYTMPGVGGSRGHGTDWEYEPVPVDLLR